MIRGTAGEEGLALLPIRFHALLLHSVRQPDRHVALCLYDNQPLGCHWVLALLVISIVVIFGLWKNGLKFFGLFAPSLGDMPFLGKLVIYAILIPIEIISFIARPLTLSLRLFANMLAGHILLKLFAGFRGDRHHSRRHWPCGSAPRLRHGCGAERPRIPRCRSASLCVCDPDLRLPERRVAPVALRSPLHCGYLAVLFQLDVPLRTGFTGRKSNERLPKGDSHGRRYHSRS